MKKFLIVLFALALLPTQVPAQANQLTNELYVLEASLTVRDAFISALQNKDFTAITQSAMGDAVEILAEDLSTTRADELSANELRAIWNEQKGAFFTVQFRDLGDHSPLIPKIEDFFNKLATKYGTIIMSLPIVQDIRTLNFAIPVVFHPRGQWQSEEVDNRIEYRKHFIPFANIVTYYGTLIACNYAASKTEGGEELKKHCKKAAEKLKFAMGRYVAPKISDWIFAQSHKKIQITQQTRRYSSAQELNEAIKN